MQYFENSERITLETVYKILTHWIGWLGHYSEATGLLAFLGNNCRSYHPSSLFSEKLKNQHANSTIGKRTWENNWTVIAVEHFLVH